MTAAPRARWARWARRARLAAELSAAAAALAAATLWATVPDPGALRDRAPHSTAFIELRRAQAASAQRPFALRWQWRRLDQISPYLRAAVVYTEDNNFYAHDGVDWDAIEKAAQKNLERGALSIGGSTITQQLAKNLYLSPSRSLLRKAREILIAGRLEDTLDKQRILELYLNVVEWGDGVFGAEAAAQRWFQRAASRLSPAQAARLAVALPNPFTRSPRTRTAALQRKVAHVLARMRREGVISRAQFLDAVTEAGLPTPSRPPQDGPVTSPQPHSETSSRDAGPDTSSSDDAPMQQPGGGAAPLPHDAHEPRNPPASPTDALPPSAPTQPDDALEREAPAPIAPAPAKDDLPS